MHISKLQKEHKAGAQAIGRRDSVVHLVAIRHQHRIFGHAGIELERMAGPTPGRVAKQTHWRPRAVHLSPEITFGLRRPARFLEYLQSLWAMDGTTLRTADGPANRAHFGAQSYARGKVASYSQVRAVSLTAIPTRLIDDNYVENSGQLNIVPPSARRIELPQSQFHY